MSYYIDVRRGPVKNLNTTALAPELYYELRKGMLHDTITELWQGEDNTELQFHFMADMHIQTKNTRREAYFAKYDFKPVRLKALTVTPEAFEEAIAIAEDDSPTAEEFAFYVWLSHVKRLSVEEAHKLELSDWERLKEEWGSKYPHLKEEQK